VGAGERLHFREHVSDRASVGSDQPSDVAAGDGRRGPRLVQCSAASCKVAAALGAGGKRRQTGRGGLPDLLPFLAGEEEQRVPSDRTGEVPAEIVELQASLLRREEGARVQLLVAQE